METRLTNVEVKLSGEDGNVFGLLSIVCRALKRAGHSDLSDQLSKDIWNCESYEEALGLLDHYVVVY